MINNFKIFSGEASINLSKSICQRLDCELGKVIVTHFSDGEFSVSFEESIRGNVVFLVQSTYPNMDNLMQLLLMVDAAKRASAKSIVAVIPYFGWGRQDKKDKPRVSIGAKMVVNMLSIAGIDRLITMDLHADQEQGFGNIPVDHLYASSVMLSYIKSLQLPNLVISSADFGGSKRASSYAKALNVPLVLCNKRRDKPNEVAFMQIVGDCKGKDVILIDDMIDTAGTIVKAANLIKASGASSVRAIASHCIMSGSASEKVMGSSLDEIVFTDSIPFKGKCGKLKQLSVAPIFAEAIRRVLNNDSISDLYLI